MTQSQEEKYANRPSPPFPAAEYCGKQKKGNDGNFYESKANKNGVCSWRKILTASALNSQNGRGRMSCNGDKCTWIPARRRRTSSTLVTSPNNNSESDSESDSDSGLD